MFYKLTQEIEGGHFGKSEYSLMVFKYENPDVYVCIKSEKKDDINGVFVEASVCRKPKKKVEEIFFKLKNGFYSKDENIRGLVEELRIKLKRESNGQYDYTLPYHILPEYFHTYCRGVVKELVSFSSRTYKTIRWVQGIEGSNHPFKQIAIQWSFDNTEWHDFPSWLSGDVSIKGGLYSSPEFLESVTRIVQSGESEPLAHELLREAYSIKFLYPRSALLISVSAAEAAIKRCITFLNPETKWLIENAASPDIITLYRDYIHATLLKTDELRSLNIPRETILVPLRKIIHMRNILAHGGMCSIKEDELGEKFRVISNLLWIIDLYMGNEWASRHIDDEVKNEMGIYNHI